MDEKTYDVYWQGPCQWSERHALTDPGNVIYSLHGTHHLYGRDTLLYIGKTETTVADRLQQHAAWVEEEYDSVTIRVASIGEFTSWGDYESWPDTKTHPRAPARLIEGVEALLIYAHQPTYNTHGKSGLPAAKGIRIFNTGKSGHVLPEISFGYHHGYDSVRKKARSRDI